MNIWPCRVVSQIKQANTEFVTSSLFLDHEPDSHENTDVVNGVVSVQSVDVGSFIDHVITASFIVLASFCVNVSTGGVVSSVIDAINIIRNKKDWIFFSSARYMF